MIKLAVSTYSLLRWRKENAKTFEDSLDWIKEAGVDAVEFAPIGEEGKYVREQAGKLRKHCEKRKLKIVSYCVTANLLTPLAEQRETVERLKRNVDAAVTLGVGRMRHDVTGGKGATSFAATLKAVVPAIQEVADYAASKGIKTSLENHGFYMQASKRVEKLIRAVDRKNYGLTIDLGNFLCVNENPTDAVRRLAKYVFMAHAKDFHVMPKKRMPPSGWFATPTSIALRGAIVGHGVVDLPAQLKLLTRAGYNGYLSLEFEGMEEPTLGVRLGLEYLRQIV